ncbi:sulfite exporter TauE/SafE family protein [Corynebacterium tapiri]|uniref:Probable membrane transporter protein n=1 Tax=Corynebacterium tapiri TaxID=1448266 RepID=A0A5C4U6T0_9CORY|nr:sulfite exporter TauE/SafE family protein [Corynebacterium tapiri]TNL99822.1 sulfite exporter TauE/SafE family protein [Corynebacterium tapiri]
MSGGVIVAVVAAAVFAGALLQRVSGMGLGLISAPILMVIFGPVEGILLVNALALINAMASTATQHRDVDWKAFGVIAPALVLGVVPGSFVVRMLPSAPLLIVVGAFLLAALGVVTLGKRYIPHITGWIPAGIAGVIGGFMNTVAGVAGPAITVYAQAARWNQRAYAATLQPLFFVAGAASLSIKSAIGAGSVTAIPTMVWGVGVASLALGLVAGLKVAPRVSRDLGRAVALGLAALGGLTAIVRGAIGLM